MMMELWTSVYYDDYNDEWATLDLEQLYAKKSKVLVQTFYPHFRKEASSSSPPTSSSSPPASKQQIDPCKTHSNTACMSPCVYPFAQWCKRDDPDAYFQCLSSTLFDGKAAAADFCWAKLTGGRFEVLTCRTKANAAFHIRCLACDKWCDCPYGHSNSQLLGDWDQAYTNAQAIMCLFFEVPAHLTDEPTTCMAKYFEPMTAMVAAAHNRPPPPPPPHPPPPRGPNHRWPAAGTPADNNPQSQSQQHQHSESSSFNALNGIPAPDEGWHNGPDEEHFCDECARGGLTRDGKPRHGNSCKKQGQFIQYVPNVQTDVIDTLHVSGTRYWSRDTHMWLSRSYAEAEATKLQCRITEYPTVPFGDQKVRMMLMQGFVTSQWQDPFGGTS